MFKKIATKFITLFVVFSLLIIVIPFNNIFADTQTYYLFENGNTPVIEYTNGIKKGLTINSNSEVRTVLYIERATFSSGSVRQYAAFLVSENSFSCGYYTTNNQSNSVYVYTRTYNNKTYYYGLIRNLDLVNNASALYTFLDFSSDSSHINNNNDADSHFDYLVPYAYGPNAVGPEPGIALNSIV